MLGHSVERLCAQAAERDTGFAEMRDRWSVLDGYYVPTRYPNSLPGSIPAHVYTREPATDAVALAEEVVRFVEARISPP